MKLSLLAGLIAFGLIAAPVGADTIPTQMDLDRATLQAQKKSLISRAMNLDEASAKTFWPLYDQYQKSREAINTRIIAMIQDYAKNYQTMTDGKATELLNTMVKTQTDKDQVRADYVKKFAAVLPGRVVARFFQADNKLDTIAMANLATQIPLVPTADIQALQQNAPSVLTPVQK